MYKIIKCNVAFMNTREEEEHYYFRAFKSYGAVDMDRIFS